MTPVVAILLGVIIGVAVIVLVARSRRSRDGVDSFRRQIDALSPEARRPVIDQVQSAANRVDPRPKDDDAADDDAAADGDGDEGDDDAGEPGGVRGT